MLNWFKKRLANQDKKDGRQEKIASIQAKFDVANAVLEQLGGRRTTMSDTRLTEGDRRKTIIPNYFPERRHIEMPEMP
jgi:hypothetical protein